MPTTPPPLVSNLFLSNFLQYSRVSSSRDGSDSKSKSDRQSERKSTTYDSNFEQILVDTGSFADRDSPDPLPKPRNWDDLREMLTRNPTQCSQLDYEDFVRKNQAARGETKTISTLFPIILGSEDIPHEQDKVFRNLELLAGWHF